MSDALIIIDLQEGPFGGSPAKHDAAGLVTRLNALAATVRAAGGTVIYVQHDGPPGSDHHPDNPGWRLLAALEVRPADAFVRKRSCDSFLDTSLESILEARGIERLIITGWATDYCVDTTVRSALARGYPTTVPSDGPYRRRQAPPRGREDYRASQRHLGRLHCARRACPRLPLRRGPVIHLKVNLQVWQVRA